MQRLIERITAYRPVNEQERLDQRLILSYIDIFADVLTRNNQFCHFTSSAFIVNESCSKVLMVHHNIFKTFSWVGGHLDGNPDCLAVAQKEIFEETGLDQLHVSHPHIVSLDILPVIGHYKDGLYVRPHLHLSIAHLFLAPETRELRPKHDENSAVAWLPLADLANHINEPQLLGIYDKIQEKIRFLQEAPF